MSMTCEFMAIGKLTDEAREFFDYGENALLDCENGKIIVSTICYKGSQRESLELAEALGIDPFDFSQHYVENKNFRKKANSKINDVMSAEAIQALNCFLREGFDFIYRPNY